MAALEKAVDQLSALLGELESGPAPLQGGITNRNFRARFAGTEVVIRLPGKDTGLLEIDRDAERAANECAAGVGVAPAVAAMLADPPCLVTHFVEGEEMSAERLREPAALTEVAAALRAFHSCATPLPVPFSAFRIVETYAERARQRGTELPPSYAAAHDAAARIEAALASHDSETVPCHNDLLAANFLCSPAGIRIVDWEYAGMGDRYFDLGNFAVNNELGPAEEVTFLTAYLGEEPGGHRLARLRAMRFMSDFREAMWAVLQGTLSDLDFDFGAYAEKHFARLRAAVVDPGFETMLEEARGAAG